MPNPNAELESTLNLTPRFRVDFGAYWEHDHSPHHPAILPIILPTYEDAMMAGTKGISTFGGLPSGVRLYFTITKHYEVR